MVLMILTLPLKRNMRAKYGDEASRMLLWVMKCWPSQMMVKSEVSSLSASFVSLVLGLDGVGGARFSLSKT